MRGFASAIAACLLLVAGCVTGPTAPPDTGSRSSDTGPTAGDPVPPPVPNPGEDPLNRTPVTSLGIFLEERAPARPGETVPLRFQVRNGPEPASVQIRTARTTAQLEGVAWEDAAFRWEGTRSVVEADVTFPYSGGWAYQGRATFTGGAQATSPTAVIGLDWPVFNGTVRPDDAGDTLFAYAVHRTAAPAVLRAEDGAPHCSRVDFGFDPPAVAWRPEAPGQTPPGLLVRVLRIDSAESAAADGVVETPLAEAAASVMAVYDPSRVLAEVAASGRSLLVNGNPVPPGGNATATATFTVSQGGATHAVTEHLTVWNLGSVDVVMEPPAACA